MDKEQVLQVFKDTKSMLSGHFKLASGRHSDTYMQCAKVFMYADKSRQLCGELAKKLNGIGIDFVASPAIGGIIMGYEMASQLSKPNIFFERIDGQMTLRRGFEIEKGAKYLVVEDVVTTGGSVKEVIAAIESMGGMIAAVCSIVDRSGGKSPFEYNYISLMSLDIKSYDSDNCPLCEKGLPLTKPGTKALT